MLLNEARKPLCFHQKFGRAIKQREVDVCLDIWRIRVLHQSFPNKVRPQPFELAVAIPDATEELIRIGHGVPMIDGDDALDCCKSIPLPQNPPDVNESALPVRSHLNRQIEARDR